MSEASHDRGIPPIVHLVNVVALLLSGVILLLTAVVRAYQLVVLLPVLALVVVYWGLRADPRVAAGYFGLSMALLGWILICENIVSIDNIFASQISGALRLDMRLTSYVDTTLHTKARRYLEPCCGDPLTWHFRPGSLYRYTFDCATCNEPYEVRVDETGYLNRHLDLMESHQQIDLFLAGDSVLQGMGVPSVVEALQAQIPLRMWNLSIEGYSPRQKINALIAYALPKQPRWLIVEFYAGNDLPEEIRNDVCRGMGDFRCRYSDRDVRRLLSQHPDYRTIFDFGATSTDIFATLADYSTHNFTLATTRYLLDALKEAVKVRGAVKVGDDASALKGGERTGAAKMRPVVAEFYRVRQGQRLAYLNAGLALTQHSYQRLVTELEGMAQRPTVILLYNPTEYEIYREMWIDPNPETDHTSAFQREALRAFAHTHGWRFLDLTEPLRQEVLAHKVWLFGRYDTGHWSHEGTAVVASVLAAELVKIIDP